ncbi:MAG: InlB B-repeat-containing protein, partial [Lachnospiraceae bacterium]|nr:InlB B-repeat-containing protein [Lachnospiraceae bacterium]
GVDLYACISPTAADIIEVLKEYCNYKCYTITYELDGGTNSSKNPAMYTASTETITLAAAVRKGYVFEGWYSDAEFNEPVTEIVKGSRGDLTLYAKWIDISELDMYQITYELNGGTNSENNPDIYAPETETIVLEDATHNNLNMKFQGWYKDAEFKEKVTQIPKGSTGDITLYAKWKKMGEGWGLANPYETLTALDGTTISTRADGRPKLLVFCSFTEGRYGSTGRVENIRDDISSFEGVDIYVIEYSLNSWERVNEVREEYGCDEMTFAYDDKTGHAQYVLAEYLYVAGMPSSGFYPPVICYIDGNDTLQYIQTGESYSFASAFDIIENKNKYCYPFDTEGTFDIAYVLDGGTNHKDNPYTYTVETETIVLKDAVKEGYQFEGWYKDAEYKEKVTQIPKGSEGDITLYAKWTKIAGKEGLNAVNPDYTFTTLDDETVSSRADGKPKVLLFFKPGCVNCQQTNRDLSEHIKYFDGVDI